MDRAGDRSRKVLDSVENVDHDRCVDVFARTDGSYGFATFRRDAEDAGAWTPTGHDNGVAYPTREAALAAAAATTSWLADALAARARRAIR